VSTIILFIGVGHLFVAGEADAQKSMSTGWSLELDDRRNAQVFEETRSLPPVRDLLSQALLVRAEDSRSAVFYAFRIRGSEIIASHQSKPFPVRPGSLAQVPETALPSDRWFGEAAVVDPEAILQAAKPIPWDAAVSEPLRFLLNGIFLEKPSGWERRELVYLVAIPALDASNKDVGETKPMVIFFTDMRPLSSR